MRTWVNGHLLARPDEPVLAVNDHGLTVGDGVFETIKVIEGQPFALTRHLGRIARSARGLGLPEPDEGALRAGVAAVLADEPPALGRIRMTVTGGPAPLGSGRGDSDPTMVVVAEPMERRADMTAVVTVEWPRNERGALTGLKTTSYAENVLALAEAHKHGATEAVFANTVGVLCEGTGSNIFYVLDDQLRTPSLASGCLAGITRALLLEWYDCVEIDEPIGVLAEAEEIFLVSTVRDVQAVVRCDGRELDGPGPVTAEAMATWTKRESEDVDP